ncbi:DUF4179 domain-containing protein (plasmid) [Priestia megaterium]|uniref:DUF4179 domain-containing protein n=1 Tax=Priestia megaterium TaxID=1404 RepID=UPI00244A3E63|nr:DUF4179 domain-containing protein [Priestia megaterium]MDH2454845.1 DUF4179 domain-containing protein [Priestia megaterium]MDL5154301.1 DUF4179 domain-containing protein [Priestia megaterium]
MKESHEQIENFPKAQVRSAIRSGIGQAEEQIKDNKISYKYSHRISNRKRKGLYALSSVAVAFGLLVASSYQSPALASTLSQIPLIGSVFADSNSVGLKQAQKHGLTSQVGETQTVNGISVTLDEILYDQSGIRISYIIKSDKKLEEYYCGSGMDYTINGKVPDGSSGSYQEKVQSATTRTAIQEINIIGDMPDSFELGLILHGKKGETWYFSNPIKKIKDIKKVLIHHSQNVDGIGLNVKDLSVSKTGTSISYKSSEKGEDFELSRAGDIEFRVVDQDGKEITGYSGGAEGEKVKDKLVFKSNKEFDPLNSHVTELTITPYLELPTDGGGVEYDENGDSKDIGFKGGSLKPVKFKSFKVKIPK